MGYDPTLLEITILLFGLIQNIIAAHVSTPPRPQFLTTESVERLLRTRDADCSRQSYNMQEAFNIG